MLPLEHHRLAYATGEKQRISVCGSRLGAGSTLGPAKVTGRGKGDGEDDAKPRPELIAMVT